MTLSTMTILDETTAAKATKAKTKANKPKEVTKPTEKAPTKARTPRKPKADPVAAPEAEKSPEKAPEVAAAPVEAKETKGPGRPISPLQVKVRRRVANFIGQQTGQFTVKQVAKSLKVSRMHVSNAIRWADHQNMVKKVGYKEEKRAGRKELLFVSLVKPETEQKVA